MLATFLTQKLSKLGTDNERSTIDTFRDTHSQLPPRPKLAPEALLYR